MLALLVGTALWGQLPLERMSPIPRAEVEAPTKSPAFTFPPQPEPIPGTPARRGGPLPPPQTQTEPMPVTMALMDELFDRPRLAGAMWRACDFAPMLFAQELPEAGIFIMDVKGLSGTLTLVHRQYGLRVYLIQGLVKKGRMGNPFDVRAKMVVAYRYWDSKEGFRTHLQTWTCLDSAMLSLISRPFRGYVRRRQQEFIEYINHNIAEGGAFAQRHPIDFRDPIRREGDPVALRQFEEVFGRKNGNGR